MNAAGTYCENIIFCATGHGNSQLAAIEVGRIDIANRDITRRRNLDGRLAFLECRWAALKREFRRVIFRREGQGHGRGSSRIGRSRTIVYRIGELYVAREILIRREGPASVIVLGKRAIGA